ncbi:PEP-CTERM sorting domain-containing protein [Thiohalocapsa sp. ML1]
MSLTDADFQQVPSGIPEPGTLACLLLGLGLAAAARRSVARPPATTG